MKTLLNNFQNSNLFLETDNHPWFPGNIKLRKIQMVEYKRVCEIPALDLSYCTYKN